MSPRFRHGYNKDLDLTEDEYWLRQAEAYWDESEADAEPHSFTEADSPPWEPEGEPFEDTYLPGIPDYDRFNRPSWGTDDLEV